MCTCVSLCSWLDCLVSQPTCSYLSLQCRDYRYSPRCQASCGECWQSEPDLHDCMTLQHFTTLSRELPEMPKALISIFILSTRPSLQHVKSHRPGHLGNSPKVTQRQSQGGNSSSFLIVLLIHVQIDRDILEMGQNKLPFYAMFQCHEFIVPDIFKVSFKKN